MKAITRATLVALAASAPATAHAALSFQATSGCPTKEDFVALVERRGGSAPAAEDRAVAVTLRKEGHGFIGTLSIDSATPREIRGFTCAEVADALSITLALELNPRPEDESRSSPTVSPPPQLPAPAPAATSAPAPPPAPPPARSHWGHQMSPVSEGEMHVAPRFAVTLSAGASFGLFPLLTTRYDATFRMASFVTLPSGERRLIGPILRARLGFVGSPQGAWEASGNSVTLSGQSLGLGMCWSPYYEPSGLMLLGCGELGLAGYQARVRAPEGTIKDSPLTLLGTLGPILEAEHALGPLHMGARLGGNFVFGSVDAARADGERLFRSRRWEGFLSVGVGGHW